MAAVGTTASMPSRPYSPRIVGSVWPRTSPEAWSETANGLQEKSAELSTSAGGIRRSADDLGSSNSGQMIEAMCERSYRTAQTVTNHSDLYGDMSKAVKETAELIWHGRERLDAIDRNAHEEIDRLKQQFAAEASFLGAGAAAVALHAAIEAIINAAAGEALGVASDTAAAIAEQAAHIGGNSSGAAGSSGDGPALQALSQQGESGDAETMTDGTPTGTPPGTRPTNYGTNDAQSLGYGTEEQSPPDPSDVESGSDGVSRETPPGGNAESNEQSGSKGNPATTPSTEGTGAPSPPDPSSLENAYTATGTPTPMPAPMTPAGGGLSSTGSSGGGLKMPGAGGLSGAGSVSPASGAGGLGSGGLNPAAAAGLSPTSSGAGLPSAASAGTPTPSSDFSRGFNAGLAGGGSVLPPPVTPPPAQPASSTAGAYGSPSAG